MKVKLKVVRVEKVIGVHNRHEREEDELKAVGFEKGARKGGLRFCAEINGGPRGRILDVRRLV